MSFSTRNNRVWLLLVLALLVALVGGQIVSARQAEGVTPAATGAQVEVIEADRPVDPLSKLDNELQRLAQDQAGEAVTAYILAEPGTDLSGVVDVMETRPFIDQLLIVAEVEASEVLKMASNPGVVAAEVFEPLQPPVPIVPGREELSRPATLEDARARLEQTEAAFAEVFAARDALISGDGPARSGAPDRTVAPVVSGAGPDRVAAPEDWNGSDLIGAPEAWAKGYTGAGVDVAVVDSGVDFAHPDLEGSQSYYDDGPYEGWPIALDPRSMRQYYYNGRTGWDNYFDEVDYTWYAGVYDVIHCTEGETETFSFDEYTFSIAPEIVAMSQSNEIRWSVHPDLQFPAWIWDAWVPFILVDSNEAGVYDTVIADLNGDLWFDEFDDTAVLGTTDPVLAQDYGDYLAEPTEVMTGTQFIPDFWGAFGLPPMWWGRPQAAVTATVQMTLPAGTFILAENHWTLDGADTAESLELLSIADISGGMVYYIADGERPVPAMDYLYPNFGPGGQPPIPANGQLVSFMLGSIFAGGGDHGTLVASAVAANGTLTDYTGAFGEQVQHTAGVSLTEEFENGATGWTMSDLWHIQDDSACIDPGYHSPTHAAAYNIEASCTYSTGVAVSGTLTTTAIALPDYDTLTYGSVELAYWSYEETECGNFAGCGWDVRTVEISDDGGATWDLLWHSNMGSLEGLWYERRIDVTAYAGQDVIFRFGFDSGDASFNDYAGWYIDDVQIVTWKEYLKPEDEGTVQGPAPDASIVAVGDVYAVVNGMQGIYDAQTFLAFGVDGEPNSGDEFADLINFSFGDGSVHNDGWDFDSRLTSYYNQQYMPNTLTCVSSGNGGYGFGTINSPQGNTTLSVGASTQYGASDVFGFGLSADQINDGDMQPFSGRGPDALGRPDPDVVATGAWGAGNTPLNTAVLYYALFGGTPYPDGGNAWFEWGGTSRSAPEACGVGALVYDAYNQASGDYPTFETAREILMSSADDLNHSVLMQGAGRVNADRATDVAGDIEGVYTTPSLLQAGAYHGAEYEAFGNVLYPGDTYAHTVTVHNNGAGDASVTVGDELLLAVETLTYTTVVSPYTGMEDGDYLDPYFYYATYFVVADPSLTQIETTGNIMYALHGDDLVIPVPAGADFMQVQLDVPMELFDHEYEDPDPGTLDYDADNRWSLTVYDWEDRNGDGKLWADYGGDGIVNPLASFDLVDVAFTGDTTETEINRFNYSYNWSTTQEATVRLGDREDWNNIVVGIVHRPSNNARPGWGPDEYQEHPLNVKVVFYQKADWDLVEANPANLTVPAGGSATFDAEFTIPADQAPGLYAGALTVDDGTHTSLIPTTVNVAVPGDELLFTLGGNERAETPYDNGYGFGAWDWAGSREEGDWRYYYYDANAGFAQQYLYVRNQWGDDLCGMPTFFETLVWGPNPGDQFSLLEPEKYGPYGNQYAGGTPNANGVSGTRAWNGWYGVDGALPESRAWAALWDGLNQVQFRHVTSSGDGCGEGYEATAGVFGVDAPGWSGSLYIEADGLSGSFSMDAVSPVDGMYAWSLGLAEEEIFRNQDVPQGQHFNLWPADLMDGWVYTFEVTNTFAIEVETFGPYSSDIDLYLLHDANGDGLFNWYDNREALAYGYTGGPEEYILYTAGFDSGSQGFGQMPDGTYAVVMYGYAVNPGDQFDLHLTTFGGDGVSIEGATPANDYLISTTPGQAFSATVSYEVPESGIYDTYLFFAMPYDELDEYAQGPFIAVPVTINAGGADFSGSSKTVDQDWVNATTSGDHQILTYTIEIENDGNVDRSISLSDLLPENTTYVQQCITDPEHPDYGDCYFAHWWFENGVDGYLSPDSDGYLTGAWSVGPTTSGTLYVQYQVKVDHGFVGTITNKADVLVDYGNHEELMALIAETEVLRPVFLPFAATPGE